MKSVGWQAHEVPQRAAHSFPAPAHQAWPDASFPGEPDSKFNTKELGSRFVLLPAALVAEICINNQCGNGAQQKTHVLLQAFRWLQHRDDNCFATIQGYLDARTAFPKANLSGVHVGFFYLPVSLSTSGTPCHEFFLVKDNIIRPTHRKELAGMR
jgi:hypothetical protein